MFTSLISVTDLAAHLQDPQWIVFDCRYDLVDPAAGGRAYAASHIAGARHLHLEHDLSGARTGHNGRHPLPDADIFCARLAALGLSNHMQVVSYDASGGAFAARLWWMLRQVGHHRVAVVDGGWNAWLKAGQAVSADLPVITAGQFHGTPAPGMCVDTAFVEASLGRHETRILDARSADRFRGENETLDPVGGHIPGASNRFFQNNLGADGCFKAAATLRAEFLGLLGETAPADVVHQCGSGVTACHNQLAMEIAGLGGSRLYPGSWSEWCSDPRRPVATGAD